MGIFSFYTADTKKPISCRKPKPITMVFKNAKGQILSVTESFYNGYGDFGSMDIFNVLGIMNGITDKTPITKESLKEFGVSDSLMPFIDPNDRIRDIAIFGKNWKYWPQLYAGTPPPDNEIDFTKPLKHDPNQGC